ncbi:MAG: SBBP repeat-containing protein, partial [Methanothrix sp.]
SALVYSTYLGGSGSDPGSGIAIDGSGNVYITGYTASDNFPTKDPIQASNEGGDSDAFVAVIDSSDTILDHIYYPDFTDTANPDSWRSWLVLQNPMNSPASINLDIRSRSGDPLYSGEQVIPAYGVNAIRPRSLTGIDCAGSVVVTSDQPIIGTCQITRNNNEMCMSYNALDQVSTTLSYPDFTDTANPDGWRSWLVLQNPASTAANINLEIRSRAGDQLYSGSQLIPAHGVAAIRPRNLVGSDCTGSAVVTADQPLVGTCQITRNNNLMCMSYTAASLA